MGTLPWAGEIAGQQRNLSWASDTALKLRSGPYDDASFLRDKGAAARLVMNSFSGVDIQCYLVMPTPRNQSEHLANMGVDPKDYPYPAMKQFAEIQTLTISSARSVFGVRRLGEHHVHKYTRGGRTIAGTMVMTTFTRDVFAEFYRLSGEDDFSSPTAPFFVDQIPPFHLIIMGENEYGVKAQSALINVTLSNFGTTLSIHDLQVESTYTYVAQFFHPFVQDYSAFQKVVLAGAGSALSPLSELFSNYFGEDTEGTYYQGRIWGEKANATVAPGEHVLAQAYRNLARFGFR